MYLHTEYDKNSHTVYAACPFKRNRTKQWQ